MDPLCNSESNFKCFNMQRCSAGRESSPLGGLVGERNHSVFCSNTDACIQCKSFKRRDQRWDRAGKDVSSQDPVKVPEMLLRDVTDQSDRSLHDALCGREPTVCNFSHYQNNSQFPAICSSLASADCHSHRYGHSGRPGQGVWRQGGGGEVELQAVLLPPDPSLGMPAAPLSSPLTSFLFVATIGQWRWCIEGS